MQDAGKNFVHIRPVFILKRVLDYAVDITMFLISGLVAPFITSASANIKAVQVMQNEYINNRLDRHFIDVYGLFRNAYWVHHGP